MWKSKRSFLPFVFVGAVLLWGCNCDDPNIDCVGENCPCEGPDCPPKPCEGPDCVEPCEPGTPGCPCTGENCPPLGGEEPFPGKKTTGADLMGAGQSDSSGVLLDPDDGSIRPLGAADHMHYMWLANTNGGYVSKYDTNTGNEVARYLVIFPRQCAAGENPRGTCQQENDLVGPTGPRGADGLAGLQPSRTAIDYRGDAWVGNRAVLNNPQNGPPQQGPKYASVTKIVHVTDADLSSRERCRNRGAKTSRDENENGVIDDNEWYHPDHPDFRATWDWTDPSSYDDCVLFTTPVCGEIPTPSVANAPVENAGVRAVAVAPGASVAGDAWAGCWSGWFEAGQPTSHRLVHLHGDTGHVLNRVPLDIRPYGAIADNVGRVWAVQKETHVIYSENNQPSREAEFALQAVDAATSQPSAPVSPLTNPMASGEARDWCSAYGIGLDGAGQIWLGGRFTEGISICRYNPQSNTWWNWGMSLPPNNTNTPGESFGTARGIAVDTEGWVYFSGNGGTRDHLHHTNWSATRSQLMVIDSRDGTPIEIEVNGTRSSAYDAPNDTGAVGVGLDTEGRAWMVNHTGAIRFIPDHANRVLRFDINTREEALRAGLTPPPPGLYTYSDFTGYQLRNYVPKGYVRFYLQACPAPQKPVWHGMAWKGSTPPGASIRVEVSYGNSRADLEANLGTPSVSYADSAPGTNATRLINLKESSGSGEWPWISITFHLDSQDEQTLPVLQDFAVYTECITGLG